MASPRAIFLLTTDTHPPPHRTNKGTRTVDRRGARTRLDNAGGSPTPDEQEEPGSRERARSGGSGTAVVATRPAVRSRARAGEDRQAATGRARETRQPRHARPFRPSRKIHKKDAVLPGVLQQRLRDMLQQVKRMPQRDSSGLHAAVRSFRGLSLRANCDGNVSLG